MPSQLEQVERALMALRLVRWLKQGSAEHGNATMAIEEYIQNGSFADLARSIVWVGDVHDELNQVYYQLIELACAKRCLLYTSAAADE